jgi:hypothetical protein
VAIVPISSRNCLWRETKRVEAIANLWKVQIFHLLGDFIWLEPYGAFTLDVKSVLNENLGGILGGTHC